MRLKEIKSYMAIRCENIEQVYELNKQMKSDKCFEDFLSFPCYILTDKNGYSGWLMACNKDFISSENYNPVPKIVEFSDLIIPEMTAEEVMEWFREYYIDSPVIEEVFGEDYSMRELLETYTPKEICDLISDWKSDHEKKEPEIETVDICRIIEVLPEGHKRCANEVVMDIDHDLPFEDENAEVRKHLKRYCMEHDGEYIAVHEVVSRVKEVK